MIKSSSKNRKETLSHYPSFKAFDKTETKKSTLADLYGEKNEKLIEYEREKELLRKRDETKAELKALLKQYITGGQDVLGTGARGTTNKCAQLVGLAQREMDDLHNKQDRAVRDINRRSEMCKCH